MKAVRPTMLRLPLLMLLICSILPFSAPWAGESRGGSAGPSAQPAQGSSPLIDLSAHAGKVVYLDFWASWCGPCKQSFPWMIALQEKYGPKGFAVVTVNVDKKKAEADKFLKQFPSPLEVRYDPEGKSAALYGLKAMPSSYLYDRAGKLREVHVGFHKDETAKVEKVIESLLAEEASGDAAH